MKRVDGRQIDEPRRVVITPRFLKHAEGSVLIEVGDTKVICAATVEDKVPPFLKGTGSGWVTAEYSMLPRSSKERIPREAVKGKLSGRTQEIQRLIGRSLRGVIDLPKLGERTVWIDCDVVQADGGTRTASISGAFVALALALRAARKPGSAAPLPNRDHVAATSVGIVNEATLLDLNYEEDSKAEVDMNVVMTGSGDLVELQGTAESRPFARKTLLEMLDLAGSGIEKLIAIQREVLDQA
jgi:ribonuclease PH